MSCIHVPTIQQKYAGCVNNDHDDLKGTIEAKENNHEHAPAHFHMTGIIAVALVFVCGVYAGYLCIIHRSKKDEQIY